MQRRRFPPHRHRLRIGAACPMAQGEVMASGWRAWCRAPVLAALVYGGGVVRMNLARCYGAARHAIHRPLPCVGPGNVTANSRLAILAGGGTVLVLRHERRAKTAFLAACHRMGGRRVRSAFGSSCLRSFCRRCWDYPATSNFVASDGRMGGAANIHLCFTPSGFSAKLVGGARNCGLVY